MQRRRRLPRLLLIVAQSGQTLYNRHSSGSLYYQYCPSIVDFTINTVPQQWTLLSILSLNSGLYYQYCPSIVPLKTSLTLMYDMANGGTASSAFEVTMVTNSSQSTRRSQCGREWFVCQVCVVDTYPSTINTQTRIKDLTGARHSVSVCVCCVCVYIYITCSGHTTKIHFQGLITKI